MARKQIYGYPVTGRDINYEQLVREAWGERWDWPQEQYSFGEEGTKAVFVIFDDQLAISPDAKQLAFQANTSGDNQS